MVLVKHPQAPLMARDDLSLLKTHTTAIAPRGAVKEDHVKGSSGELLCPSPTAKQTGLSQTPRTGSKEMGKNLLGLQIKLKTGGSGETPSRGRLPSGECRGAVLTPPPAHLMASQEDFQARDQLRMARLRSFHALPKAEQRSLKELGMIGQRANTARFDELTRKHGAEGGLLRFVATSLREGGPTTATQATTVGAHVQGGGTAPDTVAHVTGLMANHPGAPLVLARATDDGPQHLYIKPGVGGPQVYDDQHARFVPLTDGHLEDFEVTTGRVAMCFGDPPLSGGDRRVLDTLTDARVGQQLRLRYPPATANRRQMALALGGDEQRLSRTCDTRMIQSLGECRDIILEDRGSPFATVQDLLVGSGGMNHVSRMQAITSPTGRHLLRPTPNNDGLQVATKTGWADVDDAWVAAQHFSDHSEVAYANTDEAWRVDARQPAPAMGRPFYFEYGGGDTCALTAMNAFTGHRVADPNTYKGWAEVEFAQTQRKLPKTDPEHYAHDQTPASASDGLSPQDIQGYAAHLGQPALHIESRGQGGMATYLDQQALAGRDRFIIGRPGNTHTYAMRLNGADGRWYLLDNRAQAQKSYATPGEWIRTLPDYETFYALHR
jgi:hypothetical protein